MAQAETIKKYLLGFGIEVDGGGQAKLEGAVRTGVVQGELLARSFMGVAKTVGETVRSIAEGFEQTFYASRRIGDSAQNIEKTTYALSQLGVSQEQAQKALENFGRELRDNPQKKAILEALGITVNGRPTTEVFKDFLAALGKLTPNIAMQRAAQFGVDEETRFAGQNRAEVEKGEERWRKFAAEVGYNANEAAEKGVKFMQALRDAWLEFHMIFGKVKIALADSHIIDRLRAFAHGHARELADALAHIATAVLEIAENLSKWLPTVDRAISSTVGWKVAIGALVLAMSGAATILLRIIGYLGLIAGSAAGKVVGGALTGAGIAAGALAGGMLVGSTIGLNGGENELGRQRISRIPGAKFLGDGKWSIPGPDGKDRTVSEGEFAPKAFKGLPAGQIVPGLRELENATKNIPGGRKRIGAENDEFHHRINPRSFHTKGLAFDQSLNDPAKSAEAADYMRAELRKAGLSDGDYRVIDEYKNPSAHATGGHIHTEFHSPEAAEQYRRYIIARQKERQASLFRPVPRDDVIARLMKVAPLGHDGAQQWSKTDIAMNAKTEIIVQGSTPDQPSLADKFKIPHQDATLYSNLKGALA